MLTISAKNCIVKTLKGNLKAQWGNGVIPQLYAKMDEGDISLELQVKRRKAAGRLTGEIQFVFMDCWSDWLQIVFIVKCHAPCFTGKPMTEGYSGLVFNSELVCVCVLISGVLKLYFHREKTRIQISKRITVMLFHMKYKCWIEILKVLLQSCAPWKVQKAPGEHKYALNFP